MTASTDPDSNVKSQPPRSLGVCMEFAPCDAMGMEKAEPSSLPMLSPDGRPLNFKPDPGARFLSQMPLEELPVGKRVHSLNTDNRGTISLHGVHRGDDTLSIDWDNGNRSPGIWHFGLDTVSESLTA